MTIDNKEKQATTTSALRFNLKGASHPHLASITAKHYKLHGT